MQSSSGIERSLIAGIVSTKIWPDIPQKSKSVKMTIGSAARPWQALARHSAGTCISFGTLQSHLCSLQLHLSFTCSSLIHTSYTCGSLDQQSVQWMLHNWLFRAYKPASSKHWPVLWFSVKASPCFVTSISFEKPLRPFQVSIKTLIVHC